MLNDSELNVSNDLTYTNFNCESPNGQVETRSGVRTGKQIL
jgi:hypothetical protein